MGGEVTEAARRPARRPPLLHVPPTHERRNTDRRTNDATPTDARPADARTTQRPTPPYDRSVIEAQVYRQGAPPETIDAEDIDIHVAKREGVLWVDLTEATHDDFARLAEEFALNSYAIEDAVHERERPKVERFDTHAFMVLYDREI